MAISNEALTGRTIPLATGQRATAAPDHGGVHVTLSGHSIAHVVASPAEARELAALLMAIADNLDPPKGAA